MINNARDFLQTDIIVVGLLAYALLGLITDAIVRALEKRAPEPPLLGGPEVEEAERWGEEVLQPVARRILWKAFSAHPRSMHSFQQGQRNPKLPMAVVLAGAPLINYVEQRLNGADDDTVRADLAALPGQLDRVDELIRTGVIGGDQPNAADLHIATSVRLLNTIGDVQPLVAGRPAEALATRWFDPFPGTIPRGVLPADWIPGTAGDAAAHPA
jgi:glutathione S-transferase